MLEHGGQGQLPLFLGQDRHGLVLGLGSQLRIFGTATAILDNLNMSKIIQK